jgi:hypothetical protein
MVFRKAGLAEGAEHVYYQAPRVSISVVGNACHVSEG